MTTKIPLTLTLAALIGFAAPALAAETPAAKHDPQVATTTAKPKAAGAKETKASPKGRHAKSAKAKSAAKTTAEKPVAPPSSK